jgi:hypothetical protein
MWIVDTPYLHKNQKKATDFSLDSFSVLYPYVTIRTLSQNTAESQVEKERVIYYIPHVKAIRPSRHVVLDSWNNSRDTKATVATIVDDLTRAHKIEIVFAV